METGNEVVSLASILSSSKILTFEEFINSLNRLINEENKRIFKSMNDVGAYTTGYIYECKTGENRLELKISDSGTSECHMTFVPSIVKCIAQKQEGVFTVFYETTIAIIKIE